MWRHVVPGVFALAISGFIGCHCEDDYQCVVRYDPWYGTYYQYCYAIAGDDDNSHGSHGGPCTYNSDCPSGDVCSSGRCVSRNATGGSKNGPGGTDDVDGSAPGAGGTGGMEPDAGVGEPGAGGESSDAGGHPGAGATGAGGRNGSGGRATTDGGSTGSGGTSPGSGGKVAAGGSSGSTAAGGTSAGGTSAGGSGNAGAGGSATNGRVHRFDFACTRDTQCGAGQCTSGVCYLACSSDAECGTADRCSVETGRRLCMPDPNPPVRCDESAACRPEQACVNGACHDPCASDDDCENAQDRCMFNLCFPDRRPIAECVLNVECPSGLVCLDARCVKLGG